MSAEDFVVFLVPSKEPEFFDKLFWENPECIAGFDKWVRLHFAGDVSMRTSKPANQGTSQGVVWGGDVSVSIERLHVLTTPLIEAYGVYGYIGELLCGSRHIVGYNKNLQPMFAWKNVAMVSVSFIAQPKESIFTSIVLVMQKCFTWLNVDKQ